MFLMLLLQWKAEANNLLPETLTLTPATVDGKILLRYCLKSDIHYLNNNLGIIQYNLESRGKVLPQKESTYL